MLDLPTPISVNQMRRIDWNAQKQVKDWTRIADQFLIVAKSKRQVRFDRIPRYELHVTLCEDHCKVDADNALKLVVDYLRKREITADDGPSQLRKITVEWGPAQAGCKVIVRPCE